MQIFTYIALIFMIILVSIDAHSHKIRQHYGRKILHHHALLSLDLSKLGTLFNGLGLSGQHTAKKPVAAQSSLTPSSSITSTRTVPSVVSSFSLATLPSESSSFSHFLSKPIPEPSGKIKSKKLHSSHKKPKVSGHIVLKVSGHKMSKISGTKMIKIPTKAANIRPNITSVQRSNMWLKNMKQQSQALSDQINELKTQFSFTFGPSTPTRSLNRSPKRSPNRESSIGSSWETSSSFSRKSLPQYAELQHLYNTDTSFKLNSPIRSSSTAMASSISSSYEH